MMNRKPVWANSGPLVIAHRGGLEIEPENSLEAFRSAVELGVDFLESDVHVTADGVLVAFHDEELDRVTDSKGKISELPYEAVASARLEGGRSIPTFESLVEEFPDIRLNIDVKSDEAVVPFAEAVRRYGIMDRLGVGAFSDRRIRRLRGLLGPRLSTIASPRETSALVAAARLSRASGGSKSPEPRETKRAFDAVQVPVRQGPLTIVNRRFVNYVHDNGLLIHIWTINDPEEMRDLLDLGVDGIITDRPSLLQGVIRERSNR